MRVILHGLKTFFLLTCSNTSPYIGKKCTLLVHRIRREIEKIKKKLERIFPNIVSWFSSFFFRFSFCYLRLAFLFTHQKWANRKKKNQRSRCIFRTEKIIVGIEIDGHGANNSFFFGCFWNPPQPDSGGKWKETGSKRFLSIITFIRCPLAKCLSLTFSLLVLFLSWEL